MEIIDLFAGIGGFSYAFDQVFHEQKNQHIFVEIDPFCQEVLKKHWPDATIIGDIRTFANPDKTGLQASRSEQQSAGTVGSDTQDHPASDTGGVGHIHGKPEKLATEPKQQAQRQSSADFHAPFILTGGFPCQPFSQAGRRKGTSDDRHLWPEMLRVIRATKPQWIIAENVRGLLTIGGGIVFEQVCTDLESAGYEVQPLVIPAVALNAPHRRDRVWFVAHAVGDNYRKTEQGVFPETTSEQNQDRSSKRAAGESSRADTLRKNKRFTKDRLLEKDDDVTDTKRKGYERKKHKERQSARHHRGTQSPDWSANWLEVATELCRVDDGLSGVVDRNRVIEYIGKYDYKKRLEILEKDTEGNPIETVRLLRIYVGIAEASLQGAKAVDEGTSPMSKVPHKRGYGTRQVGGWQKEKETLRRLRELVSAKESRGECKSLLAEMPLDIRTAQRIIAVASQRNARLKSLGNAIVPQVAEEIFKAIKLTENL